MRCVYVFFFKCVKMPDENHKRENKKNKIQRDIWHFLVFFLFLQKKLIGIEKKTHTQFHSLFISETKQNKFKIDWIANIVQKKFCQRRTAIHWPINVPTFAITTYFIGMYLYIYTTNEDFSNNFFPVFFFFSFHSILFSQSCSHSCFLDHLHQSSSILLHFFLLFSLITNYHNEFFFKCGNECLHLCFF